MSRYMERSMLRGERVLFSTQLHWVVYHSGFFSLVMAGLFTQIARPLCRSFLGEKVAEFADKPIGYIGAALFLYAGLQLIVAFVRQIATELVITNQRVIAKHGLVSTTTFEVMLSKVEGANIDQTVMGRLLGYGTIMVKGTGGGISPIDHIAQPLLFHSRLMDVLSEAGVDPVKKPRPQQKPAPAKQAEAVSEEATESEGD